MKFPNDGKLPCCTQRGLKLLISHFLQHFVNFFPLQGSKISTDISHVDVKKVKNCIIKE